jgi:hypothetical protein
VEESERNGESCMISLLVCLFLSSSHCCLFIFVSFAFRIAIVLVNF